MKLLITGGAGFIGSNFIMYMMKHYPSYHIINMDALTYAGNLENLESVHDRSNYTFIKANIKDKHEVDKVFQQGLDMVINFCGGIPR